MAEPTDGAARAYRADIERVLRGAGFDAWTHAAGDADSDPEYRLGAGLAVQYSAREGETYSFATSTSRSPLTGLSVEYLGEPSAAPSAMTDALAAARRTPPLGSLRHLSTRIDAAEVASAALSAKLRVDLLSLSGAFTAETRASLALGRQGHVLDFAYAGLDFDGVLRGPDGAEIARYRDATEVAHDMDLLRRGMAVNRADLRTAVGAFSARIDGLHSAYIVGTAHIGGHAYPITLRAERSAGSWRELGGEPGGADAYDVAGAPALPSERAAEATAAVLSRLGERDRELREAFCRAEAERSSAFLLNVVGLQGAAPHGRAFYRTRERDLERQGAYARWLASRPDIPLVGREHDARAGWRAFERDRDGAERQRARDERGMDL